MAFTYNVDETLNSLQDGNVKNGPFFPRSNESSSKRHHCKFVFFRKSKLYYGTVKRNRRTFSEFFFEKNNKILPPMNATVKQI